jgi:hypothetical protein
MMQIADECSRTCAYLDGGLINFGSVPRIDIIFIICEK